MISVAVRRLALSCVDVQKGCHFFWKHQTPSPRLVELVSLPATEVASGLEFLDFVLDDWVAEGPAAQSPCCPGSPLPWF